jgi:hypothetical protein
LDKTLTYGQSCTVTVTAIAQANVVETGNVTVVENTAAGSLSVRLSAYGVQTSIGSFYPFGPTRIMDTRTGVGGKSGPLGQGSTQALQVAGAAGLPSAGIGAVVLNVTVTDTTGMSYLTVFPTGTVRPNASNLNFLPGSTVANSVTVRLNVAGQLSIYNAVGTTSVIVDIVGYYAGTDEIRSSVGIGGLFRPGTPKRIVDTRTSQYGAVPAGYYIGAFANYGNDGNGNPINPHVRALAVNVTAVDPQGPGYLTTWNGVDGYVPNASTVNFTAGQNVPNFAIVPTSDCSNFDASCSGIPYFGILNGSPYASVHIIVDVLGYFTDDSAGLYGGLAFTPASPTRIADTRFGTALGPYSQMGITDPLAAANERIIAAAMNITAVGPTASGFITVWPSGTRPGTSTINTTPNVDKPNAVYSILDVNGAFKVYNDGGSVNIIADVGGYFGFGQLFAGSGFVPLPLSKTPPGGISQDSAVASSQWSDPVDASMTGPARPAD